MSINIDLYRTQQHLDWIKEMLYLNTTAATAKTRRIYRGQVYRCKLGIGIGSEESRQD